MRFCYLWLFLILFSPLAYCFSSDIQLTPATFAQMPGWQNDQLEIAFKTFQRSCLEVLKRPATSQVKLLPSQMGSDMNWKPVCEAALQTQVISTNDAKVFFEKWFTPYAVSTNGKTTGLFTGYYLPLIHGELHQSSRFQIPIYGLPSDLVKVDLGQFKPALNGTSIVGRVQQGKLLPYPTRADIVDKGLPSAPIIAWTDNWIDLFFAQVQGSAILELPHHQYDLLGYASGNGHPYTSIARILINQYGLVTNKITMTALRKWLQAHPNQLHQILNTDASYVFFKTLSGAEPLGTEQIPLTAGRSLAIDQNYLVLGTPIFLSTNIPTSTTSKPFNRLMIAQDTGGAINGIIRGDIYFGAGDEAVFLASNMKNVGKYWVLLPKN